MLLSKITKKAVTLFSLMAALSLYGCGSELNSIVIAPPGSLSTTPGDGLVTLSWGATLNSEGYRVFFGSSSPVSKESPSSVDTRDTKFRVTGLANNTKYFFRLATISATGDIGPLSDDEVFATPFKPAPPPTGLTAFSEEVGVIDIRWDGSPGANSYKLYWKTSGGVLKTDNSIDVSGTSFRHIGLDPDITYHYRVATVTRGVIGFLTSEVSAKPKKEQVVTGPPVFGQCNTPAHQGATWSVGICGPANRLEVNQGTTGDDGSPIGRRGVANGRVSFKIAGVANGHFTQGRDTFLVFFKAITNGREHNWHWQAWGAGSGIGSRLTVQKFDGTCNPFCDKGAGNGMSFEGTGAIYQYHCGWDTKTAWCDIFRVGDNAQMGGGYRTITFGAFGILDFFAIGRNTIGGYPTVPATVSDLRFSLM